MEKEKVDDSKLNLENGPKDNDTTISSKLTQSTIRLHWSFNILIYYKLITTLYRYQILFATSLFRFGVWLHKIYEDVGQAIEYSDSDSCFAYFIVSLLMLILPTLMCTIYLILTKLLAVRCRPRRRDIIVPLINGLFLVPWQAKECLNTLHYAVQRICDHVWSVYEKKKVISMSVDCDLLEFFEDMFSGFLGICLQLYIIFVNSGWTGEEQQETKVVTGELIGSILSLLSMIVAIQRKDDRLLTSTYVGLGWICMFMSRALAFCLATTIIKYWIVVIILAHAVAINHWVYKIARQSYLDIILADLNALIDWKIAFRRGKILLWSLSFVIYGLPSIIYWPLMFQMKDAGRTQIFLLIILLENIFLGAIWTIGVYTYQIPFISFNNVLSMNLIVLVLTLLAIFWIHCYIKAKPYCTDKKVLLEILKQPDKRARAQCAVDYGVSYIFYSKVFALPTFNELLRSIPPYCYEDSLLFSLVEDSTEEEKSIKCISNGIVEIKIDLCDDSETGKVVKTV